MLLGAENQQRQALEEIADANGRNEHGQRGGVSKRLIGNFFQDDTENGAEDDAYQHAKIGRNAQHAGRDRKRVCPDHNDIAMREVQHLGDAIDHGIPKSDERIDAPAVQAVDQLLKKFQLESTSSLSKRQRRRIAVSFGFANCWLVLFARGNYLPIYWPSLMTATRAALLGSPSFVKVISPVMPGTVISVIAAMMASLSMLPAFSMAALMV